MSEICYYYIFYEQNRQKTLLGLTKKSVIFLYRYLFLAVEFHIPSSVNKCFVKIVSRSSFVLYISK